MSLKSLVWDEKENVLRGESSVVRRTPYRVWVYVPKGYSLRSSQASVGTSAVRTVSAEVVELTISSPQTSPTRWELGF